MNFIGLGYRVSKGFYFVNGLDKIESGIVGIEFGFVLFFFLV